MYNASIADSAHSAPSQKIYPLNIVQFEIQRYSDGVVDANLPSIVWVDRAKPLQPFAEGIGCKCNGPFYPIRGVQDGREITTPFAGYTPSVCACMGRFVE